MSDGSGFQDGAGETKSKGKLKLKASRRERHPHMEKSALQVKPTENLNYGKNDGMLIAKRLSKNCDETSRGGNRHHSQESMKGEKVDIAARSSGDVGSSEIRQKQVEIQNPASEKDRKPQSGRASKRRKKEIKENRNDKEAQPKDVPSLPNLSGVGGSKRSQGRAGEGKDVDFSGGEIGYVVGGASNENLQRKSSQTSSKSIFESKSTSRSESQSITSKRKKKRTQQKSASEGDNASRDVTHGNDSRQDAIKQDLRKHQHNEESNTPIEDKRKQEGNVVEDERRPEGSLGQEVKICTKIVAAEGNDGAVKCERRQDKKYLLNKRTRKRPARRGANAPREKCDASNQNAANSADRKSFDNEKDRDAKQKSRDTSNEKIVQRSDKRRKKHKESRNLSIQEMRYLLDKSPETILDCLLSDLLPIFEKTTQLQQMKSAEAIILMKVLSKACSCENQTRLDEMFRSFQPSSKLTLRVMGLLDTIISRKSNPELRTRSGCLEIIIDILNIVSCSLNRFPNSSFSSPVLVKLHKAVMSFSHSKHLLNKEVVNILQELMRLKKKGELEEQQRNHRFLFNGTNPNFSRRPPENFRHLSIVPTLFDILAVGGYGQRPFIRKNIVLGSYEDVEHYLDIHFRLYREDFLGPLRNGIQLLMATRGDGEDRRLKDVWIYNNAKVLKPLYTSNGVRHKLKFHFKEFQRVQWETSKRLTFGSLLCLSKDNFKTLVFATVAERNLQAVRRGVIEIRIVSPPSGDRLRKDDVYQMVESIAFFEGYRPVLVGLQRMSSQDFPFKKYIVHVKNEDINPPSYLRVGDDKEQLLFDFTPILPSRAKDSDQERSSPVPGKEEDSSFEEEVSRSKVAVLDLASWPSAKDLELDDSQLKALQLALTKEFAVIQGPPGTGKTYIGLKIAKMLLHNRNAWSADGFGGPILVVCYTNHALDQFLEGILDFHPDGIIRVGGRSQSEKLKHCGLSALKKEMIKNKQVPKALRCAFAEVKNEMKELAEFIGFCDKTLEELKGRVFHEDELKQAATSMTQTHYDSLVKGSNLASREMTKKNESAIPDWLGLPVPPMDPYQDGFVKPLAMFPFDASCQSLEYFSQNEFAIVSKDVIPGPGPKGHPQGSLQLKGTSDSYIMIPNLDGGIVDAETSITMLAFIYPMRKSKLVISYDSDNLGVQFVCEFDESEKGELSACFIQRDLASAENPITAHVLTYNEWNFVGASYDFETGFASLWHDGIEVKNAYIGKGIFLATQFPIQISVKENSCSENEFSARISHLHIYDEAITLENIQAVGGIACEGIVIKNNELSSLETDEKAEEEEEDSDRKDEARESNTGKKWKSPSFKFDVDVLEEQRILESDELIRFDTRPASDGMREISSTATPSEGGFQYQNARRMRQKIKDIIRKELKKDDMMSEDEATQVDDVWKICDKTDRWRLYRRWVHSVGESCHESIFQLQEMLDYKAEELQELRKQEDYQILKNADVVGMTTTGAAKNRKVLQDLKPVITIVEEAAEVFEAHIVTSLTPGCQHLILIGDHQQLRPSPKVYELETKFALDVSLFERMVKNGIQFERLNLQHRMRPEIARLLDHIYVEPKLRNHSSVHKFEDVRGVERNVFFVDHNEPEDDEIKEGSSKSNLHEAKLLTALCRYLIQQGYQREQIAVLTAYSGQLHNLRREMLHERQEGYFEGVRVTSVDNFQGEESDIILLSLVRSKKIGFLKIENRVCVALSRAREGLFILGNAKLLEEHTSGIWHKIINDLRENKSVGTHLKLVCQIHPQNGIQASTAEDFLKAPHGGCTEPCQFKMPDCEHQCTFLCHPVDIEHKGEFACQMKCTRSCGSGHPCSKKCSEDCGPCMVKVPKRIPMCDHEQEVPCSMDPSEFKCKLLVPKQAFPCGHTNSAECSVAPADIICQEPCGVLECGHPCQGNCITCLQGRLHQPCYFQCERTLPCGHKCVDACVRPCPPCSEICRICKQKCCHPCRGPASYARECPHYNNTEIYAEPYKGLKCDKPCREHLSCGHPCIGICGDIYPQVCRICSTDANGLTSDGDQEAKFVELVDCGHVFEVSRLDSLIAEPRIDCDEYEIKQKQCPECGTLILHSLRYPEIVSDFNDMKRQILLSNIVSKTELKKLQGELNRLKFTGMRPIAETIENCLSRGNGLTSPLVSKCLNQVTFLKFLEKLYHVRKEEQTAGIRLMLDSLRSRILQERVCFSLQEIKEFVNELSRTKLVVYLESLMTAIEDGDCTLNSNDEECINRAKNALASGKTIDPQELKQLVKDITKIKQHYRLPDLKFEATDSISELEHGIVLPKHFAQGAWYRCSKGHVYSASAESIKDENTVRCVDCSAATKRNNKTQKQVSEGGKRPKLETTKPAHKFPLFPVLPRRIAGTRSNKYRY